MGEIRPDSYSYGWTADTFKHDFMNEVDQPNMGECQRLAMWMGDYIDQHFFEWSKELLHELRDDIEQELDERVGAFVYQGFVFTPYKLLKGGAAAFDYMSRHTTIDYLSEWLRMEWSYEAFYEAAGVRTYDIFECDGGLWIPGRDCLFRWTGEKE